MTVDVHLPTVALTLFVALGAVVVARWPAAFAAEGGPVRCDRYDVTVREREDREEFAEKQRAQVEAVLTTLYADGYTRMMWADAYLTTYVAGEGHYVGFVCLARP